MESPALPLIDFPISEMCPICGGPAERRFREDDTVIAYICEQYHAWPHDPASEEDVIRILAKFGYAAS